MDELTFNHPSEELHGFARIGRKEIVTYTTEGEGEWGGREGEGVRCRSYQLTRIRCWKVGYMVRNKMRVVVSLVRSPQLSPPIKDNGLKWFAFDYHHGDGKDDFVWVRLVGKATIFLTLCIQSAVNELIRVRLPYLVM